MLLAALNFVPLCFNFSFPTENLGISNQTVLVGVFPTHRDFYWELQRSSDFVEI